MVDIHQQQHCGHSEAQMSHYNMITISESPPKENITINMSISKNTISASGTF